MKQFQLLDISGDMGIRAFGKDLKELFVNAALAMYSQITDLDAVKEKKSIGILLESSSVEGLFVLWLNELIFYFDTYGFIGLKIIICELTLPASEPSYMLTYRLKADLSGEEFDTKRHKGKLLIKAATYHKLRIEKKRNIWEADIVFDI